MKLRMQHGLMAAALGASLLSGCAPLVLGGAVVTSVVAVDRRTAGTQLEDEGIELKVASAIHKELGERVHLNVTSYNRQVLLSGEVANERDKQMVEGLVEKVENVKSVANELAIMPPSAFFTAPPFLSFSSTEGSVVIILTIGLN